MVLKIIKKTPMYDITYYLVKIKFHWRNFQYRIAFSILILKDPLFLNNLDQ